MMDLRIVLYLGYTNSHSSKKVFKVYILRELILSVVKLSCRPSPFNRTKANKHVPDQNKRMAHLKSHNIYWPIVVRCKMLY